MGEDNVCDQHLGRALEQRGVFQRLGCAIDGAVDPAPLAVEHGSPGENVGEAMLGVRNPQVGKRGIHSLILIVDRVVAETEHGAREWFFAALAQFTAQHQQFIASLARLHRSAALQVEHDEVFVSEVFVDPIAERLAKRARFAKQFVGLIEAIFVKSQHAETRRDCGVFESFSSREGARFHQQRIRLAQVPLDHCKALCGLGDANDAGLLVTASNDALRLQCLFARGTPPPLFPADGRGHVVAEPRMREFTEIEGPLGHDGILLCGRFAVFERPGREKDVVQLDLAAYAFSLGQRGSQLQALARKREGVIIGKEPQAKPPGGHCRPGRETGVSALCGVVREIRRARQVVARGFFEKLGDAAMHDLAA